LLTGALHLDGFLDTCDGLLGGHTPETRLEIMRDERIGAYGFAGGILLILTKYSALTTLDGRVPALLLAPIMGRWGMAAALFTFPYGREEGLGRQIKDNVSYEQIILATIIALAAVALTAGWVGLVLFGIAVLTVWCGAIFTLKRIPGLTGDIYGALNELVETSILIALVVAQTL
jgi:adenosylcobinamide-GDP ribazoletransferase